MMYKVIEFIANKHNNQMYGNEMYIKHLQRVANRFSKSDLYIYSLALLHDVIEDTNATYKEVKEVITEVFKSLPESDTLVTTFIIDLESLTDNTKDKYPNLNRSDRKSKYREQLQWASYNALSVKYADIIDNLSSLHTSDKSEDFKKLYLQEKDEVLRYCAHGNWELYKEAITVLVQMGNSLKSVS